MVSLILTLFSPSFQVLVHIGFKMYACKKLLMHKTEKVSEINFCDTRIFSKDRNQVPSIR